MKLWLLFLSVLPCLIVTFCIIYPIISNEKRIFKIGDQLLIVHRKDPFYEWHKVMAKYLNFPLDHSYGSHAIVLLAAVYLSKTGPILELGMGSSSTPILHRLSFDQKRLLVSADSDQRWINRYTSFTKNNSFHRLRHIAVNTEMGVEWAMSGIADSANWSVVFIDHRPGPRRKFDLMLYATRSDLVVLHDTEKTSLYKYHEGLPLYPYQYRFQKLNTHTDVLSLTNAKLIEDIRVLLKSIPDYYFGNITLK